MLAVLLAISVVVRYPGANLSPGDALFLRGQGVPGLSWASGVALRKTDGDTWTADVDGDSDAAAAGEVYCKVLVNDTLWQKGPNTRLPAAAPYTVYPYFGDQAGRYEVGLTNIYSPHFDNYRDVLFYLPPSYDENPLRPSYPTLLMHDGQNLCNTSTSFGGVAWLIQDTLDSLIGDGDMEEIVVIGVYNTPKRILEYTYSVSPGYGGGGGAYYVDFLEQTVLPAVESAGYRVDLSTTGLTMGGSSLGGLISCWACYTRPEKWASCVCMSSSFWWNSEDFLNVIQNGTPPPTSASEFYLDSGDPGDDHNQTVRVRNRFEELGFVNETNLFYYSMPGGEHNEYYWGKRFHVPMLDLFAAGP